MEAKGLFRVVVLFAILFGCDAVLGQSTQLQDEHFTIRSVDGTLESNLPWAGSSDDQDLDGVYRPQLDISSRVSLTELTVVIAQNAALITVLNQTVQSQNSLLSELNATNVHLESELNATIARVDSLEAQLTTLVTFTTAAILQNLDEAKAHAGALVDGLEVQLNQRIDEIEQDVTDLNAATGQTITEVEARLEDKISQEIAAANDNTIGLVGTLDAKLDQNVDQLGQGLTDLETALIELINGVESGLEFKISSEVAAARADTDEVIASLKAELGQKLTDLETALNGKTSLVEVEELISELDARLTSKLDSSSDIARIDAEILAIVDLQSQSVDDISGITARMDDIESQIALDKAEVDEQLEALNEKLRHRVSRARLLEFVTEFRRGLAKCVLKKRYQ
ncbi:hypothetical protein NDN08_004900 [Rhodosorus marinus]|uniref:Uncharacterized protein n=1 Tax=Rhodosorus marinus TaxID=101924 RepID=A0AAV8UEZ7_9RHOD|nr:hypothetical protein NDN08_004900 [Rhodosorus marinus]